MQILLWSTSSLAPLRQLFPGSIFLDVQLALADTCLLALSPLAPQRKVTRHPSHHTHTSTMSYCSHKRRCFCFLSLLSSAPYPTASFRPLLQTHKWLWLLRSTSHVTRHTSHLTPHTSHLTRLSLPTLYVAGHHLFLCCPPPIFFLLLHDNKRPPSVAQHGRLLLL